MISDSQLIFLLQKKPEAGLKKLNHLYGGLVYTIINGRLSNSLSEQDVEECTSDVLYEVYEKLEIINLEKGSLKGFIALTAKRRAIDHWRKAQIKGSILSLDNENTLQLSANVDLQQELELAEFKTSLVHAITDLGHPDSEILIRKFYYNQRTKEIAKILHMKENTIDQRVKRSLEKLRKQKELLQYFGGK